MRDGDEKTSEEYLAMYEREVKELEARAAELQAEMDAAQEAKDGERWKAAFQAMRPIQPKLEMARRDLDNERYYAERKLR